MLRHVLSVLIIFHIACAATPPAAVQQARNLKVILQQADEAYYNKNESLMSDAAYDALREQYEQLLSDYPELTTSLGVGTEPPADHRIDHNAPVLSLQKAYCDQEVSDFLEKCGQQHHYCVEPKVDGLTVVLHYRDGLLTHALTRGDGKTGTDVTTAILASGAAPSVLTNAPALLDVRGEAFLPFPAFETLNQRRIANGESPLKNPRNTASGTLQMKDYVEVARRGLKVQVFELLASSPEPATHTEALKLIRSAGLPVIESRAVPATDVLSAVSELNLRRPDLPFPTDGIVIRLDNRAVFKQLGHTAHHPRGTLARKYKETPKETRLLNIEWSRGESGKRTPVAIFEPIEIGGVTIQRASLHNLNHLRAMDLMIGDRIQIIRAGGSVPEVIGRSPAARTGNETAIPGLPAQ